MFVIKTPYDPEIIEKIRKIPGRRFDFAKKRWHVPNAPSSVVELVEFAFENGFNLDETAADALEPAYDIEPLRNRQFWRQGDRLVFKFDFDGV